MKLKNYFLGASEEMAFLASEIEHNFCDMGYKTDADIEIFAAGILEYLLRILEIYKSLLTFGGKQCLGDDIFDILFDQELSKILPEVWQINCRYLQDN